MGSGMTPSALARVRELIEARYRVDTPDGSGCALCSMPWHGNHDGACFVGQLLAALTPAPSHIHGFAASTNTPAPAQWECPACGDTNDLHTCGFHRPPTPPPPEPSCGACRDGLVSRVSNHTCGIETDGPTEPEGEWIIVALEQYARHTDDRCSVNRCACGLDAALARARGK